MKPKHYKRVIFAAILGIMFSAKASEEKVKSRILKCPWTDTPPVIDGKMQDKCWSQTKAESDFRVYLKPSQRPSQQTEVRVCYDADNLYIFWKLYDSNMKKLFYGPPEDMRDMLKFGGDVAETFLDPGKTEKNSYQFCASPLGTRFDASYKKGRFYTPDWKVKPSIHKDSWELEIAIPFASLAHNGEYFATPQKGDEWGIQFCRDQASLHEWSVWSPSELRGFNQPKRFGKLIFEGNGREVKIKDAKPLFFGINKFDYAFSGMNKLKAAYQTLRNGKPAISEKLNISGSAKEIEFNINEGGKWQFDFSVFEGSEKIYHGFAKNGLPYVMSDLRLIESRSQKALTALSNFKHPRKIEMESDIKSLLEKSKGILEELKKASGLSNDKWKDIASQTEKLMEKWKKLKFDLNLIELYNKQAGAKKDFALGAAAPDKKIYRDFEFKGKIEEPVKLSMAGGEYESFQMLVIPFWKNLKNVDVKLSPLKGKDKTIPAKDISWFIVDYVHMNHLPFGVENPREYEPDILMPAKKFNVQEGKVKTLWFDVRLPENTPEGDYEGAVTVSCDGQKVEKKLIVHSFGFDLPKKVSLTNNLWFHPYKRAQFYGKSYKKYDINRYKKHAAILGKYRITPFADHYGTMWSDPNAIDIYAEEDGHFSFDFSKWKEFLKVGIENGGNSYGASLGCNSCLVVPFFNDREIIDRKTGKKTTLFKVCPKIKELNKLFWKKGEHYEHLGENPFFMDFMKEYINFLKENKAFEMSYWEYCDEPNSNVRWKGMLRLNKLFRKNFPEMKLLNFGVSPEQKKAGKKALGYIDIWAPHLPELDDKKLLDDMKQRRLKYGEKYWFYTCGERSDSKGNNSPFTYYHRPYLGCRIHAWFAWKYDADGMLIFAMSGISKENIKKDPSERWPASEWQAGVGKGCGVLIYPGPDYNIIPSIRLANIRDGMEDYEYFAELKRLSAYVDPEKYPELSKEIKRELKIENSIIDNVYVWTKNIEDLKNKRRRLAALIKKTRKAVE